MCRLDRGALCAAADAALKGVIHWRRAYARALSARPTRPIRGNVFRLRPGHWWWEVIDGTPKRENVVTVGFANTQAEALRLCLLALRIESGPRR